LLEFWTTRRTQQASENMMHRSLGPTHAKGNGIESELEHIASRVQPPVSSNADHCSADLAQCFLRLANLPTFPLDRLSRYEANLWRQTAQTIFALEFLHRRKPWETPSRLRPRTVS
jgi:hypothetical protein